MKKILMITVMGLTAISLAACGASDEASKLADKAKDTATAKVESTVDAGKEAVNNATAGYSKADFMKACETGMTAAQCKCYVDFYQSIGLSVADLGDSAKVATAMQGLNPKQAMKAAQCAQ